MQRFVNLADLPLGFRFSETHGKPIPEDMHSSSHSAERDYTEDVIGVAEQAGEEVARDIDELREAAAWATPLGGKEPHTATFGDAGKGASVGHSRRREGELEADEAALPVVKDRVAHLLEGELKRACEEYDGPAACKIARFRGSVASERRA